MKMSVSIIIPNYNGKNLLERNLPILFKCLKNFNGEYEVIVVDDGSNDNSLSFINAAFGQVRTVSLDKNYGFSHACNAGVRQSKYDIVYLLNNDVEVTEGFIQPLLEHFFDGDVFAVSSVSGIGDRYSAALVKFKLGIFWYWYEPLPANLKTYFDIFVATGGHTAFDKNKFLQLNGFDTIFNPFYAEDGDICWRAWKRGWRSILEPRSLVTHGCQGTIGKLYRDPFIKRMHWKNRTLMTWKNLTSFSLIARHILFIFPEFLFMPIFGKKEFSLGVISALKQWPQLINSRKRDKIKYPVYSDKELFTKFSRPPRFPAKVLYLHETSRFSGAENSLLNLVIKLDSLRFSVIFALPEEGPLSLKLRGLGFNIALIKFPRIFSFFAFCNSITALVRLIKEKNVDIIHSNSIRTHLYSFLAGRFRGISVVWHERNLITDEMIDPEKMLYFLPDKIICNSHAIARRFAKKGKLPGKVSVIYNGMDTAEFSPLVTGEEIRKEFKIKPEQAVIGIASRFSRNKGHEIFLKAAQIILNNGSDCAFLVSGGAVFEEDHGREKYLRGMVKDIGMDDRVIFTGFREDMPKIYAAMDIFVLASDAEPCGRVILEAMASGKPVIGTNSGGTPEIVIDDITGYLVEPNNPRMLAEKIAFLVKNRDIAEKFGRAGRRRTEENFSIEKNVRQTEKIYAELIAKPRF